MMLIRLREGKLGPLAFKYSHLYEEIKILHRVRQINKKSITKIIFNRVESITT